MYVLHKKNGYLFFYCLMFSVAWPSCYGINSLLLEKLNWQKLFGLMLYIWVCLLLKKLRYFYIDNLYVCSLLIFFFVLFFCFGLGMFSQISLTDFLNLILIFSLCILLPLQLRLICPLRIPSDWVWL
jgi:hypothetical protein